MNCERTNSFRSANAEKFKWIFCLLPIVIVATLCFYTIFGAKSLYSRLAEKNFSSIGMNELESLDCHFVEFEYRGLSSQFIYRCELNTSCKTKLTHVFFVSPFLGATTGPDPFPFKFARSCPDMLQPEVLGKTLPRIDQGG